MAQTIKKYWTDANGITALQAANASGIGHSHAYYVDKTGVEPFEYVSGTKTTPPRTLGRLFVMLADSTVDETAFHANVATVLGIEGVDIDTDDAMLLDPQGVFVSMLDDDVDFAATETNGIWK